MHSSSLSVTPLEVLDLHGDYYNHGTGFIYRVAGDLFLVTAWHVASGRNFFTRKLNSDALIPTQLRFFVPEFHQSGEQLTINSKAYSLSLKDLGTQFLESPPTVFDTPVDVAVAKLPMVTNKSGTFTSVGLNEFELGLPERTGVPIASMVGADVFVLGYPLRTYEGLRTPIWKRGSLASEPAFQIEPKGAFLVDANTTGGMSGGPIIRRVTTMTVHDKDKGVLRECYDEAVVGIYSGRAVSQNERGFVLGYGWPIDVVHEVIRTAQCISGSDSPD